MLAHTKAVSDAGEERQENAGLFVAVPSRFGNDPNADIEPLAQAPPNML